MTILYNNTCLVMAQSAKRYEPLICTFFFVTMTHYLRIVILCTNLLIMRLHLRNVSPVTSAKANIVM